MQALREIAPSACKGTPRDADPCAMRHGQQFERWADAPTLATALRREAPAARWTVAPGDTGSTMYFYARVIDITLGVMIVLLFDLIFPWCAASTTCR